jgi:hypothetical protein
MTDFAQSADTEVIRGHHFDDYIDALEATRRNFGDTVATHRPLFDGGRRSDVDRAVEQLPGPDETDGVLAVLARLPTGDENQLREAAGLFERVEAENIQAAGGWVDTHTSGPIRH